MKLYCFYHVCQNFYMNIFHPDLEQNIYTYDMTAADRFWWQKGIAAFAKNHCMKTTRLRKKWQRVKCFLKMRRQPPKCNKLCKAVNHTCDNLSDCHSDHFQKKQHDNTIIRYVLFFLLLRICRFSYLVGRWGHCGVKK